MIKIKALVTSKCLLGLSLIEIIVSMAIFSVIATMGYGGLSNVIDLQREQKRIQSSQEDLQRVLLIMARDFYQIVPRPIRDNTGKIKGSVEYESNNNSIEFTRSGNSHPVDFNRSQFLRISYKIEGDELSRYHWLHLDRSLGTVPLKNVLLKNVKSIDYRFLDNKGTWSKFWGSKDANLMPSAIELNLTLENNVEYLHLFPITQPL